MLGVWLDSCARRARSLVARVAEDIGRRGDVARLARRVAELNARLAVFEPRGEAVGVCQVCGGALHVVARGLRINAGATHARRDLFRCARCWALRPIDRPEGDAGVRS